MTADETRPQDFKNIRSSGTDPTTIKGWSQDADPDNDPTYPIKSRDNSEQQGYTWKRPPQQPVEMEILHSVERPNITAVFGTSSPPSGLSGMLRRHAFKYSESSFGHWLPLILADRINEVEGIIDDIKHGKIPNFFAERGWGAEWKYNRKGFLVKAAAATVISALVTVMLVPKKKEPWYRTIV